jgi:hypothetical protein
MQRRRRQWASQANAIGEFDHLKPFAAIDYCIDGCVSTPASNVFESRQQLYTIDGAKPSTAASERAE